jgi:hypothetical protein
MSWNYRIIRKQHTYNDGEPDEVYDQIAEVYYNSKGKPYGWCSAHPSSNEGVDGLRSVLAMMASAFDKPILAEDLTEWGGDETEAGVRRDQGGHARGASKR